MKLIGRRSKPNVLGPLFELQRFNYSPLPVKPRIGKSSRSIRKDGASKLKDPIDGIRSSSVPFWNLVKSPPAPKYSWTDYQSIPSPTSIIKEKGRIEQEISRPSPIIVQVPKDPDGILQPAHPAAQLLSQSALIVVRQLEMMNLFIGFEQANRYRILSPTGETIGFLAEEESGLSGTLFRQIAGTHRSFQASILTPLGHEVLRIRRPFSFINSRIFIQVVHQNHSFSTAQNEIIGETQQEFHLWRRKYNLFTRVKNQQSSRILDPSNEPKDEDEYEQFAKIDAGFLSWDFYSEDGNGKLMGSVSRNFTGFGREIFTDTGQYVIRFDAIGSQVDSIQNAPSSSSDNISSHSQNHLPSNQLHPTGLTLDQRAVMLATAVSIDFDYFSRTHRGGLMPPIFFGGGSSSDDL